MSKSTSDLAALRRKAEQWIRRQSPELAATGEDPSARLVLELRIHQVELEQQNEELTSARRALEDALQEHTQLFEFAPIGYFVVTANSTIRKVNLAGARLVGIERGRLVGLGLGAFVLPAEMGRFQQLLETTFARSAEDAGPDACEITLRWKGDRSSVRMTSALLPSSRDEVPTALIAVEDITERRRAQQELRDANERLLDADRRKNEFLGMLSHELRNPLAPIRNAVHVLERVGPTEEVARRAVGILHRQSEHLTRLVNDLLDVTRITRGKIALRRSRLDLREIVVSAVDDCRPKLAGRGIDLRMLLPDSEVWCLVDPIRVNQVLTNLLDNAAKFTERGGEVVVSLGKDDATAELHVRDTGAGIDPTLLPHLFEPFVQADRTLARSDGGLGLGLALVKGIVDLHGGEVRAASAGIGKGTEFVIRFPVSEGAAVPETRDQAAGAGGGRRVLVVDDNRDSAESLADLLRSHGHEVDVAFDGTTALEKLRSRRPDVVLCDIGLPGMNGYEVVKAARANGGRDVRFVALSGYARAEDVQRSLEAGFDAHVAKPPDPEEIARLLA